MLAYIRAFVSNVEVICFYYSNRRTSCMVKYGKGIGVVYFQEEEAEEEEWGRLHSRNACKVEGAEQPDGYGRQ